MHPATEAGLDRAMERRLAAILAADVVGYSRLMGQNEAGTLAAPPGPRRDRSPEYLWRRLTWASSWWNSRALARLCRLRPECGFRRRSRHPSRIRRLPADAPARSGPRWRRRSGGRCPCACRAFDRPGAASPKRVTDHASAGRTQTERAVATSRQIVMTPGAIHLPREAQSCSEAVRGPARRELCCIGACAIDGAVNAS